MPGAPIPLSLPRHAASPRGVGRAGEIWRLFQEAAVQDSIRVGWPPERYNEHGSAFVVYGMSVRHHRELRYGEPIHAETWVEDFRRGILSRREVRLHGPDGPIADGTQRWVHVGADLRPKRAPAALMEAFALAPRDEGEVDLPAAAPLEGAERRFAFEIWHGWMDPLGHVNHPAYLDFCDESTSRALGEAGLDPVRMVPVAEQVDWKRGAGALERLVVHTRVAGRSGRGDAVLAHRITDEAGALYATATTVRRLVDDDGEPLLRALGYSEAQSAQ